MYLTDLADACRSSGLRVVEQSGWRSRGHGQISSVRTIVCHHTAGPATGEAPSLNYIQTRSLSQLVLGRSGTVYVVAAGLCYHAGVVHEAIWGNRYSIGIEAEATGRDPWPSVQYDAYARLCAALISHYKLPISDVRGHKEVAKPTGRKIDPNFDMPAFRRRIAEILAPPPPPPSTERRILREGMSGLDVWDLQAFMNRVFPTYSKISISRTRVVSPFGPQTKASIMEFQRRVGITADGIVGPTTYRNLERFGF
jgi:N-acetyl-anhydromuramyl-L-alanine amidase AmpD